MVNPIQYILEQCLPASTKKALIIYDNSTRWILKYFSDVNTKKELVFTEVDVGARHGEEQPQELFDKMLASQGILCITQYSLAHTRARIEANYNGIPFLSMSGYDEGMMGNEAFFVDYRAISHRVDLYADILSSASTIQISTEKGTELVLDVSGRKGNSCPGITDNSHLLGSPPDIEANIAPIENATNGAVVVDGSITDYRIGLLKDDVFLKIEKGSVVDICCKNKEIESRIKYIFEEVNSEKAYVIGELGIGFNDAARLCGNMLIDEGAANCIHFGIGSNWTIGGENKVNFHLDFVLRNASVKADENVIIEKGKLLHGNKKL